MSKEFMNDIFDSLIQTSANALADEALYDTECEEFEFSQEHQKKMNALFRGEQKKYKKVQMKKSMRKISAVAAVFIVILSIFVMSVSAWRVKILNFVLNISQTDSDIDFDGDGNDSYDSDGINLGYIPKDFVLTKKDTDNGLYLKFEKDTYYFSFKMNTVTANMGIDTENADMEKISINGHEGIYSENDNHNILVWYDEEFAYSIVGNSEKSDIVKIAENIKKTVIKSANGKIFR